MQACQGRWECEEGQLCPSDSHPLHGEYCIEKLEYCRRAFLSASNTWLIKQYSTIESLVAVGFNNPHDLLEARAQLVAIEEIVIDRKVVLEVNCDPEQPEG